MGPTVGKLIIKAKPLDGPISGNLGAKVLCPLKLLCIDSC